jgi:hypothetical protein
MRITPSAAPPAATTLTAPSRALPALQGWLVGQMLSVRVLERVDQTTVRVAVEGAQALARTTLDLRPGNELSVRVAAAGERPVLSIVTPPGADVADTPVVTSALKSALPVQAPMDEVLRAVAAAPSRSAPLPAMVATAAASLLENLPVLDELAEPAGLRHALSQAGNGLEAALAASGDGREARLPTGDLKWQLLGLHAAISRALSNPGPEAVADRPNAASAASAVLADKAGAAVSRDDPMTQVQLLRGLSAEVEAGIARITTHQLQQLVAAGNDIFLVQAEIPYRAADQVDALRVEIENRGAQTPPDEDSSVEVNLALPLPALGEFRAHLTIRSNHLAVTLWSEAPALRAIMAERLGELTGALAGAGFEVGPVGLRRLEGASRLQGPPDGLVDTRV